MASFDFLKRRNMEKEIDILDEKSEYDYDKLLKKLKLVRNGFKTTGK